MTVPDRIEREILIETPREVVWRVVTEPDQIVQWFCDEARLELDGGGSGVFTWENRAASRPFTANLRVVLPIARTLRIPLGVSGRRGAHRGELDHGGVHAR